jgi:serine/threonine protein kinase
MAMPCPELDELERHASGESDDGARRRIAAHLTGCASCRAQLAEIADNLGALGVVREFLKGQTPPVGPTRVGPYRIVRELGRGGMGVVYLAEQEKPAREVALKVLRPGGTAPGALRRFELEAESLARLHHPGIAAIYDAGVADVDAGGGGDRVPYFAMEYVRGLRLDRYVRERELDTAARVELLARVADAVHHAHARGVIHRDLKPSNILVESESSGASPALGNPRILDFGVARAAGLEAAAESMLTTTGEIVGTLPYMSPEQLGGDSNAVDARSDVYALGVVGFELLTGGLPHHLSSSALADAARIVRDTEAPRLGAIDPRLKGDLDAIVGKALEKDPERRYASASELASDLRRHLADEPVTARPPSTVHHLRRFARRHRGAVTAAALLVVVLAASAVVSTGLALRAARAERLARARLADAEREARRQGEISAFLTSMLASVNPHVTGGARREVTVLEVLDRAARELDAGRLASEPQVEASVRSTLGDSYWALARYDSAEVQLRTALALCERTGDTEGRIKQVDYLGLLAAEQNRYAEAESLFHVARGIARGWEGGPRDRRDHWTAKELSNLAGVYADQGRFAEAESVITGAVAVSAALAGEGRSIHVANLRTQGSLRYLLGDLAGAESAFRGTVRLAAEVHGADHPNTVGTLDALAVVLDAKGDLGGADSAFRAVLEHRRAAFGDDHPRVAEAINSLANVLIKRGDLASAEPMLRQALTTSRAHLGTEHQQTARCLSDLAEVVRRAGRPAEAVPLSREAVAIGRRVLGRDHPRVAGYLNTLARARRDLHDYTGAEALWIESVGICRAKLGPDHRHTLSTTAELADLYETWGRHEDAARWRGTPTR